MHHNELAARIWTAFVLAALGAFQFFKPEAFYSCSAFFRRARARLSPEQTERLQRVLDARRDVEGVSPNPSRYAGLLGIAMAGLELIPAVPFAIPYAIFCLAGAFGMLASYLHVRRATERRAAPLVPRSPFDALSPVLVVALAVSFAGVALFASYPEFRAGTIGVAASMLILIWIAWRIAGSQAVLFGNDPQLEYAVDERLRRSRVTGTASLACAPAVVLVGTAVLWVPQEYQSIGIVAVVLTYASFAVVIAMSFNAKQHLSDKLLNAAS